MNANDNVSKFMGKWCYILGKYRIFLFVYCLRLLLAILTVNFCLHESLLLLPQMVFSIIILIWHKTNTITNIFIFVGLNYFYHWYYYSCSYMNWIFLKCESVVFCKKINCFIFSLLLTFNEIFKKLISICSNNM